MAAASLIGFGLVVLAVSMLSSLVLTGTLVLTSRRMRAAGPRVQRLAAAFALALPPVIGLAVSAIVASSSLLSYWAGRDHCLSHGHHLHLCPVHGAAWLSQPWAVAVMAFFGTFVLVRLCQTIWGHLSAHRAARRLRLAGQSVPNLERTFIVSSADSFAFTIGVFSPTIIISRAAWNLLDPCQRLAVLAHENAHLCHGDLWKRAALGILACCGAPVLTRTTLRLWEVAAEHESDQQAVRRVGKPSIVASAILTLARAQPNRPTPALAAFAAACHVSERVHLLLAPPSRTNAVAKRLLVLVTLGAGVTASAAAAVFAESLHHFLETILG